FVGRVPDPGVEVEPLLEVDINNMIAAHDARERHGASPDIDPAQVGDFSRLREQIFGNSLKVVQLARELPQQAVHIGSVHRRLGLLSSHCTGTTLQHCANAKSVSLAPKVTLASQSAREGICLCV